MRANSNDKNKNNKAKKRNSPYSKPKKHANKPKKQANNDGLIRLNKYLANAGVASRREADELIKAGVVAVNGKVITEMGYKIKPTDKVKYGGESIRNEKKVYLLMNKPKDYITTVDDPFGRKTVLQLLGKIKQRVYPVGRLDRATTGLLLFTNDGDLTRKLTHPKFGVKKIYHVTTDKNVTKGDLIKMTKGVDLEDGEAVFDVALHVGNGSDKKQIGVELHSGKNRVIRRTFEALGYKVVKLDRVVFAGLTKKDLPRGKWRYLSELEVSQLKMHTNK